MSIPVPTYQKTAKLVITFSQDFSQDIDLNNNITTTDEYANYKDDILSLSLDLCNPLYIDMINGAAHNKNHNIYSYKIMEELSHQNY